MRLKSPALHLFTQPLIRRRSKKTSKLRVTGLCVGNSPGTGEFPAQRASNAENVSIWWRHHVKHWWLVVNWIVSNRCKYDFAIQPNGTFLNELDQIGLGIDVNSLDSRTCFGIRDCATCATVFHAPGLYRSNKSINHTVWQYTETGQFSRYLVNKSAQAHCNVRTCFFGYWRNLLIIWRH